MPRSGHYVFSLVCFCLIFNVLQANSAPGPLALFCGSTGGKDQEGQEWESDQKYLVDNPTSTQSQAGMQDPSLLSTIPYMQARIFTSPSTYQFSINATQRYLLRLHFYPSVYSNFDAKDSYFNVNAGGVVLLTNFSASITCQALTQAYLIREYSLAPMNSPTLNLTFTPSSEHKNTFAFINGIELIPMPDGMFGKAKMVGDNSYDSQDKNVELMFRLNVGGQYIPAANDSAKLARRWYDDFPYVFGAATGVTLLAADNVSVSYGNLPDYSAPLDIYKTARSMGPTASVNSQFNLTWSFQVHSNFFYVMRLHFCEFQLTKVNQKVFNIAINNQTVESDADIIGWTASTGAPTYKDYVVYVNDLDGDDFIKLELFPATGTKPQFLDAQLNGLEIFKVETNKNLSGPNPQPSPMLLEAQSDPKKSFKRDIQVIGVASGSAAAVGLLAIIFVVYKNKKKVPGTDSQTSSWLPISGNSHTTGSKSDGKSHSSHLSTLAQGLCRHFSLYEIKQATKSFDESNVIGVGGFGKVYKGVIDGGMKVAIKRSNPSSEQGVNEFQTEIEMLSKLRHKHLVSLIGFCEDDGEMCLVYDYMARGTLREHIYNCKKPHLSWKQRLEICIGAARGLHYLHTGAKYTIIHRDVKTTNILLNENWVAKVSDFGLSKTGPDMNQGHVSTVVKGSFGYLDPEYFRRQQLTEKSDVYSFGVVLFEVLCARPALNPSLQKEQVSLADWAISCQKKGVLEDIIDPYLKGKINAECLKKFAETAEKCLYDHGLERPSMGDVLWNLEFALQLQETADGTSESRRGSSSFSEGVEASEGSSHRSTGLHISNLSLGSQQDLSEVASSTDTNASVIFSQIVNPTGR